MVSAAQRKARAKFAYIMKHGGFRKFKKRNPSLARHMVSTARHIRHHTSTISMPRRRHMGRVRHVYHSARASYHRRGGARGMLGGARGLFKTAAAGVGGGIVAEQISSRVFPQATPIAGYAGSYLAGGTKGLIAKVAFDAITGQSGLLSMFGGGGGSGGGDTL